MSAVAVRKGMRLLGMAKKALVAAAPITCGARLARVAFFGAVNFRLLAFRPHDEASIKLVDLFIFLRALATSCTNRQDDNGDNEHW